MRDWGCRMKIDRNYDIGGFAGIRIGISQHIVNYAVNFNNIVSFMTVETLRTIIKISRDIPKTFM